MNRLNGKIAVVTGSGSGIGEATAKLFAREGASVVLVARHTQSLRQVQSEIEKDGGKAIHITADLGTLDGCHQVIDETIASFGRIDVLVNNAGITDQHRPAVRTSDQLWDKVVLVNMTSVFYMCREALQHMQRQGNGNIINVSSIAVSTATRESPTLRPRPASSP